MNYEANIPIWLQVMNLIKADIVTGKRAPGDKLPGGRDLALSYSINPNTAARVYRELEDEGLCETRRGMGTYVTEDKARISKLRADMADEAVRDFINKIQELGISYEEVTQILDKEAKECWKANK